MIQPRNKTDDLLLSVTKNCETLIHQTQTRPQRTLELKFTQPRETFHLNHLSILVLILIGWLD